MTHMQQVEHNVKKHPNKHQHGCHRMHNYSTIISFHLVRQLMFLVNVIHV